MKQTLQEDYLQQALVSTFKFDSFRPGQREAITTLMEEGRLLCILPTGHGKSLLYQLPASLLQGITIVISPLLALVRDQIDHLQNRFGISAASINSDQTDEENEEVRYHASQGKYKLLFVAPEQLDHVDRFNFLLNLPVSLVVVDEAHCISTWGHDFRPSYRQIVQYVRRLQEKSPKARVLGLTATADAKTEEDIKQQLSTEQAPIKVLRDSMDRPNISLSVIRAEGIARKLELCCKLLSEFEGSGLIYCATRENTEIVADFLKKRGLNVESYHAGYPPQEKRKLQAAFIQDAYKALAATNALGMGIDKQNLRYIIHFDVPGSVTAYYQEVGRCGRDGLPSKGIILFDPADKRIQQHFIDSSQPKESDFHQTVKAIREAPFSPKITQIKQLTGMHPTRVTVVVAELAEQGFIEKRSERGSQVYTLNGKSGSPCLERYQRQYEVKTSELNQMMAYAESRQLCRMQILRQALGDLKAVLCGHCDVCRQAVSTPNISSEAILQIQSWLDARPVTIKESKKSRQHEGLALLDGPMRSPHFIHFMKQRAVEGELSLAIPTELFAMIQEAVIKLHQQHCFVGIIPLPSRTWLARDALAQAIGAYLNVPVWNELLIWQKIPSNRQGENTNNDQRRENVKGKMAVNGSGFPSGKVLLLDDYIGCGATLNEAGRALAKTPLEPVPFTVAAVRWKLGQQGMI